MPSIPSFSFIAKLDLQHGGEHRRGRRKIARPIDPKRPLHVVLRSSRARGQWSMLRPRTRPRVENLAREAAAKWGLKLYRFANVGNHLHLLVLAPSRRAFQGFLREFAGKAAALITGATKGNPSGRFWDGLAWTRIVSWGRDLKRLASYFIKNLFEAEGVLDRRRKSEGWRVIPLADGG